jgi:peptidoglycan hydrolase CwlO-like protein
MTDPAAPSPRHHRPWGWIIACVLLVLVAGGLLIWALGLNSDLDDQRDQTAQAQQQATKATQEVESLSGQVDAIEQTVTDASDQLAQTGEDARQSAQSALDGLKTKLGSLKDQIEQATAEGGTADDGNAP